MGFEIPQLKYCCCGCTLKTGTKIIGWLELISSLVMVVASWFALAALTHIQENPKVIENSKVKDEFLELIPVMKMLLIVLIVAFLVSCVLSFILLLGVYQNKPKLVFVWIVASLAVTLITAGINIAQIFTLPDDRLLTNVLTFLLNLYYLLVVYSYYRENNGQNSCA